MRRVRCNRHRLKSLGGVEGLEKKIAEEEGLKKKSEEKSMKISAKTRSRLALLLSKTSKAVDTQEKQTVRY
jgi:hypothetical protein